MVRNKKSNSLLGGIFIFALTFLLAYTSVAWAGNDAEQYQLAVQSAKKKKIDFAFMHFQAILAQYPESKYRKEALFAQGEYFYRMADFKKVKEAFTDYLVNYPDGDEKIFALAYLLKACQELKGEEEVAQLKREIISYKRTGLVFKEYKEYAYRSPLNQKYKARYFINKIQFYVENKLFSELVY